MKQKKLNIRAAALKELHTTAYVSYSEIFIENFLEGIKKFKYEYAAIKRQLRRFDVTDIRSLDWRYVGDSTYEATFYATKEWRTGKTTRLYDVPDVNKFTIRVVLKNSPEEIEWVIM